ncbi:MAG: hypothetical protein N2442_14715 [Spirochaetes bacterium]|nr:hypothetical protein [Spirochaetota bacterium]
MQGFLLALCLVPLEGEETVFLSNEIGMPLELLQKSQETPEYRLVVKRLPDEEIRILLNREGVELKRWETRMGGGGVPLEKKEFKEGILQRRSTYDPRGRIIQEVEFEAAKETGTLEYLYTGSTYRGVVFKPSQPDSRDRDVGYKEEILYTPSGTYRGIYRQYDSGAVRIARALQSKGVLQREVFQGLGVSFLARYNSKGDAIYQEVRKEGVPIEQSRFWYSDKPIYHLERIEAENLTTGTRKVLWYSDSGLLEREIETIKDVFLQETRYSYQGKQLIGKELRTRRSRYRWEYRFDGDGKKVEEKQYENDSISLHIDFSPPEPFSRIESRYKGGSLIMRTYFKEDAEFLVEFYRDGVLLRSVKKGNAP